MMQLSFAIILPPTRLFLFIALLVILGNILTDVICILVDPRQRFGVNNGNIKIFGMDDSFRYHRSGYYAYICIVFLFPQWIAPYSPKDMCLNLGHL